MTNVLRRPHAVLDSDSRTKKARKIVAALERKLDLSGRCILEVGTGSGIIAQTLAGHVGPQGKVTAVDVVDQRQVHEGYRYELVTGTALPFPAASFDVVIANHVFEHVGDRTAQAHHLSELARVVKPSGWIYFAVPNRWGLVEPHYRLALLSWLPTPLRSAYVRLRGRGELYDWELPSHRQLQAMFRAASLQPEQFTFEAMRIMAALESPSRRLRFLLEAPRALQKLLYPVIPTMVFLLKRASAVGPSASV